MDNTVTPTIGAHLMILAGCIFFVAAVVGLVAGQFVFLAFFGIGAAFLGVGAAQLRKPGAPAA